MFDFCSPVLGFLLLALLSFLFRVPGFGVWDFGFVFAGPVAGFTCFALDSGLYLAEVEGAVPKCDLHLGLASSLWLT